MITPAAYTGQIVRRSGSKELEQARQGRRSFSAHRTWISATTAADNYTQVTITHRWWWQTPSTAADNYTQVTITHRWRWQTVSTAADNYTQVTMTNCLYSSRQLHTGDNYTQVTMTNCLYGSRQLHGWLVGWKINVPFQHKNRLH